MTHDFSPYLSFAHQLADASEPILRRLFRTQIDVEHKGDDSPVTLADKEVERDIRLLIEQHYPEHDILGEEEGLTHNNSEFLWCIDPIDGTRNFIAGKPLFTTLISLCYQGTPVAGIINQPITGERWAGIAGHPSTLNGEIIRPRPCPQLANAIVATTSPHLFSTEGAQQFEHLRAQTRDVVYGADAYAYALLASGFIDIVLEEGLKFHDIAALIPVIEGEGGSITDWQGNPLAYGQESYQVLACGDKRLLAQLI